MRADCRLNIDNRIELQITFPNYMNMWNHGKWASPARFGLT